MSNHDWPCKHCGEDMRRMWLPTTWQRPAEFHYERCKGNRLRKHSVSCTDTACAGCLKAWAS